MTDKPQPAHFDWATELSDAQGHVTLSEQEAHEIGARLRASHGQAPATAQADGVPAVDQSVMELAESVGLIGPTSRIGDLHAAIQRFHDLICVNATIKAASMAAEVISSVAMPDLQDAVVLLRKYRRLCQEVGRGDSAHLDRIEAAAVAVQTVAACAPADSVPAVDREQERIAFKEAHQHLELYEVPDAWGRPMFKHSHVEASWLGWIARTSHGQAPAVKREFTNELGNSIRITVEGPNSMHENIVTPMEAKQLREALNEHAQAAPTYKDSTPELHIGDSAFESWYSSYSPAHKSDKQRAGDAYAAGMGDPLVMAAPAAVAVPDEIDRLRAALVYVAFALHGTRQYMLAEGVTLIDGDTVRVSRDGWTVEASSNPLRQPEPQPSPAVQGDALDAERYRWLAASCRSTSEHWGGRWSIIIDGPAPKSHDSEDDFDAAIDAARAAQEGK